mmetsp:Transcript_84138/g.238698  ORF Transcript_84138/g.238698 Transcript_84138/m.238698 type:complete len:501 (-) Transcript_84138:1749-3251(-)
MSSMSFRATSASLDAAWTFSATPCIWSMAFRFGLSRSSSTRRRSSSARYSSSSIFAAGPDDAACFSCGRRAKSTAMFAALSMAAAGPSWVGALAAWLGASARSWRASSPPRNIGTSTSSSTLCRRVSTRASSRDCSADPRSPRRFSTAMSCCRFVLATWRRPDRLFSFSRSRSRHSLTLRSCSFRSASRASPLRAQVASFSLSWSISAWSFERASSGALETRSFRVVVSITNSAFTLRSRRVSWSLRAWPASRSFCHSRSSFRTSSTPIAALSRAKWLLTALPRRSSTLRCSSRSRPSSRLRRAASGSRLSMAASTPLRSSTFCFSCSWHQCSWVFASWALLSRRRTSSWRADRSAVLLVSVAWITCSRRSIVSIRFLDVSSSVRSNLVAPSRVASEFTERLPFLAMDSPASVTSLQLRPRFFRSPKASCRASVIVSAMTVSPRRNSNAFAYCSSKETQVRASRRARWLFTTASSRGSGWGDRRSFRGRNVIGANMRSLR